MPNFADVPAGVSVLIDANLLAYFFIRKDELAQSVAALLTRGTAREITVVTSATVVAEVIHRVLIAEAIQRHNLAPRTAVQHLKEHPAIVKDLREHLTIPNRLYNRYGISILPVTYVDLHASRSIRSEAGLMTNDSLVVAVMQRHKITHLVTNDSDFERVKTIRVWRP